MSDAGFQDDDRSIDDLLDKMYGSHSDAETKPLDPEQARGEAIRLSKIEDEIVELALAHPTMSVKGLSINANDAFLEIGTGKDRVKGVGLGTIDLLHYNTGMTDQADIFNAQTPNSLDIHLHTDNQTMAQAKELVASSGRGALLGTRYIFDSRGTYGKLVFFPDSFQDDRDDALDGPWSGRRMIAEEMTASDFELAGAALEVLKSDLS